MRILLTGGSGMLGKSTRRIAANQFPDYQIFAPSRTELNLTDRAEVAAFARDNAIEAVVHGAARVGGIQANIAHPVEFLVENLRINDGVIMGAYEADVERLFFLGSSCMYPKDYKQPLKESYILEAPLEPTNEGYALSKITGAKLCEYISETCDKSFKTLIPCNLFGEDDHFGSQASHLVAAIVNKIAAAKSSGDETVEIWGTGNARREFLLVDDLSRFILASLPNCDTFPPYLNVGYGDDHSVLEYYEMVADIFGYKGKFTFDTGKPEGMMAKLMDSEIAKSHGWNDITPIKQALKHVIATYSQKTR